MGVGRGAVVLAVALSILAAAPVSAAAKTFSSGNRQLAIKDRTATTSTIKVRRAGTIKDVNVLVRLDHAADQEVDLYLVSPKGKVIQLSTNNGGDFGGQDYGTGADNCTGTPTVFDDEATTPIFDGEPPFAGTFKPEQRLAGLDRSSQKGTWRLIIGDNSAAPRGSSSAGSSRSRSDRRRAVADGSSVAAARTSFVALTVPGDAPYAPERVRRPHLPKHGGR